MLGSDRYAVKTIQFKPDKPSMYSIMAIKAQPQGCNALERLNYRDETILFSRLDDTPASLSYDPYKLGVDEPTTEFLNAIRHEDLFDALKDGEVYEPGDVDYLKSKLGDSDGE